MRCTSKLCIYFIPVESDIYPLDTTWKFPKTTLTPVKSKVCLLRYLTDNWSERSAFAALRRGCGTKCQLFLGLFFFFLFFPPPHTFVPEGFFLGL